MSGVPKVVSSRKVAMFLRRQGMDPNKFFKVKAVAPDEDVKFSRKDVKKILTVLNARGWVCLEKRQYKGRGFVFIGPGRVTIKPLRFTFDDPKMAKKASQARFALANHHAKTESESLVAQS